MGKKIKKYFHQKDGGRSKLDHYIILNLLSDISSPQKLLILN